MSAHPTILTMEMTASISAAERTEIEGAMSEAMGGYIEKTGKLDFSTWTPEEWAKFVGVAFDVAAPACFMKRIAISPPYTHETVPF